MYETSAGIESELLDLSTVNVATLRAVELTRLDAAIQRVRARIADAGGSISGFSGSFWHDAPAPGTRHEDRAV